MTYNELIESIRQECSRKGISVYKLSRISGIPQSTIYGIFRNKNKAQVDTLCEILEALQLDIVLESPKAKNEKNVCFCEMKDYDSLPKEKQEVLKKLLQWLVKCDSAE